MKVRSYSESAELFGKGARLLIQEPEQEARPCEIEWSKPYKNGFLLAIRDIDNREKAALLAGSELMVERDRLPETEDGSYYWCDLIGLSVLGSDGQNIGRIEEIIPTGSNDVYVVRGALKEVLIPALESVVLSVDLDAGTMKVELPEGL